LRVVLFEPENAPRKPMQGLFTDSRDTVMSHPSKLGSPDIWSPYPVRPYPDNLFNYGGASLPRSPQNHSPGYETGSLSPSVSSNLFSGIYSSTPSASFDSVQTSFESLLTRSTDTGCSTHTTQQNWSCRNVHSSCPHSASPCQKESHSCEKGSNQQLAVPGKNIIDLDRISRGLDTRTTV
jgi:hypothetical protein